MLRGIRKKALILLLAALPQPEEPSHDRVLKQVHDFETAFHAMDLLLDDRGDEGTKLLQSEQTKNAAARGDPAAVLPLALGVMRFIEATLGFEPEVMLTAHTTLAEAEEASLAHSKHNQKLNIATSHIYPPGTEFQVTYAELTLLNALVMLLQENNSMVEQAKALLKLRKAYQILEATYKKIKESEPTFNRNLARFRKQAAHALVSSVDLPGFDLPDTPTGSDDVRLMNKLEKVYQMRKSRIQGAHLGPHPSQVNLFKCESALSVTLSHRLSSPLLERHSKASTRAPSPSPFLSANSAFLNNDDSSDDELFDAADTFASFEDTAFLRPQVPLQAYPESVVSVTTSISVDLDPHLHVSTIDEFIHSGVQLCFGILQVVLSLIPPTIGKVLSIVGFKGNREVGLHMLWRTAITARNIHGELALLCLLVFYDGPIQFIDTGFHLPGQEDASIKDVLDLAGRTTVTDLEIDTILRNPNLYTPQLLAKARSLFPHNALWALQEGRVHAAQGNIDMALDLMQKFTDNPDVKIQMEQVEALLTFDRAMFYAFVHDYNKAARDYLRLLEINSWSQAVYLFAAGASYLEKWRMITMDLIPYSDAEKKKEDLKFYADKAEHYLKLAPTYVPGHGHNASKKKGGIGGSNKQMPFDKFVLRKSKQIENRQAKFKNLLFIECVGTSLIHELTYFWNGYNRMPQKDLQLLYTLLGFSAGEHAKFIETTDEAMIRHFFQSVALRKQGKMAEGVAILDTEVIAKYVTQDSAHLPFKFTKMTYSPYLYPTALFERANFVWEMKTKDGPTQDALKSTVVDSILWLKKAETVADVGDYELSNRTSMRIKAASERLAQIKTELHIEP